MGVHPNYAWIHLKYGTKPDLYAVLCKREMKEKKFCFYLTFSFEWDF